MLFRSRWRGTFAALATAVLFPLAAQAQPAGITAQHAVLMDLRSGSILYSRGADEPLHPASLTKLMTLAVVFEELKSGKITLDTEYPVSVHAWRTGGAPSGTATMFAAVRSRVRVEDLIIGAAAVQGNDATLILAEGLAGSEAVFADRMNKRAAELGLATAVFRNPTGFSHPEQKISTRDLARLAAHIISEYPAYYKYFAVPEITWSKVKQHNRNPLLSSSLGVDGMATGFDEAVGYGFVAAAVQNNQRLIAVVYGTKSDKDRVEDTRKLLDWGFRSFADRLIFSNKTPIAHAAVFGGNRSSVPLVGQNDIHILALQSAGERFTAKVHYEGPLRAPIKKGAEVARLRVYRGDQIALDVPLYAAEEVEVGGLAGRAFDATYEYIGNYIRSGFKKLLTRGSSS
jgi:D-alanyl-D-alanine carboxypeptidase (penicillin-binding protein 5/6)